MQTSNTKYRLWNIAFVLALVLASVAIAPAPAHAQTTGNSVYLPFLMGSPALDIPANGPTLDEVQALFATAPAPEEMQVSEPAPEIQAAGSCYRNAYSNILTESPWGVSYTRKTRVADFGSACRDLNIHTVTLSTDAACFRYLVIVWDVNGNTRDSGVNTVCRSPERWKVLTYNIGDEESYQVYLSGINHGHITLAD